LDNQELLKYVLLSNRNRPPEHKKLKKALAKWQLWYNRHPDSGLTTRELLVLKAKEFWAKLLCYTRKEEPKFLIGWLNSFKKRYKMKERR
jgi:hypothetical protein